MLHWHTEQFGGDGRVVIRISYGPDGSLIQFRETGAGAVPYALALGAAAIYWGNKELFTTGQHRVPRGKVTTMPVIFTLPRDTDMTTAQFGEELNDHCAAQGA